jgi:hypothetical protein
VKEGEGALAVKGLPPKGAPFRAAD